MVHADWHGEIEPFALRLNETTASSIVSSPVTFPNQVSGADEICTRASPVESLVGRTPN